MLISVIEIVSIPIIFLIEFYKSEDLSRLKLEGLRRLDDVLLYVKKDSKKIYGADIELIKEIKTLCQ